MRASQTQSYAAMAVVTAIGASLGNVRHYESTWSNTTPSPGLIAEPPRPGRDQRGFSRPRLGEDNGRRGEGTEYHDTRDGTSEDPNTRRSPRSSVRPPSSRMRRPNPTTSNSPSLDGWLETRWTFDSDVAATIATEVSDKFTSWVPAMTSGVQGRREFSPLERRGKIADERVGTSTSFRISALTSRGFLRRSPLK